MVLPVSPLCIVVGKVLFPPTGLHVRELTCLPVFFVCYFTLKNVHTRKGTVYGYGKNLGITLSNIVKTRGGVE